MKIIISNKMHLQLGDYARQSFPNECCGFLLGNILHGTKIVQFVAPVKNKLHTSKQKHAYLIAPEDTLAIEKFAGENNMSVLGYYHSHPNSIPKPSKADLNLAWPYFSYFIVAVTQDGIVKITSWQLNNDRKNFIEEKITVI